MGFDLNELAPWNWFKKEQEAQQGASSVPVTKASLPASPSPSSLDPLLTRRPLRADTATIRGAICTRP